MKHIQTVASLAIVLTLSLTTVACSTNPATGKSQLAFIGEEREIQMGKDAHQQVLATMGAYDDPELQRYVDRIGQRLAANSERPNLPWTFTVVDDASINAFAIPGGFVYLTRGILTHMSSEAEMAGVLGHEIGHITARHSVEQLSRAQLAQVGLIAGMIASPEFRQYGDLAQQGLGLAFLKFGRDDERQADDLGLRYIVEQNYNPLEMAEMFRVLDRVSAGSPQGRLPNWLSTHPNPRNRVARIEEQVPPGMPVGDTVTARDQFLAQTENVVFGADPREGYFLGNSFYHPELRFRVQFPRGWQTQNQKQAVAAVSPNKDAVVVLQLAQADSPRAAAQQFFGQQGIQAAGSLSGDIGGLPTVGERFVVQRQQGGDIVGYAAFVEHQNRVYQLMSYTVDQRFRGYEQSLSDSLLSFGRLTDRRYIDVSPKRVDLVRIDRDMTIEEFNRRYPSNIDLQTLAIINHVEPGESLRSGQRYKRVTGGELPRG
jgi:predicted Zn-dependent protease